MVLGWSPVENEVPDYDKYITNADINKLQAEIDEILKQAKLATKDLVDNVELCSIENWKKKKKIQKLNLNGLSLFIDKSYFSNDGSQNFLIF